ncbi:MAG: toxin TcdB middle/N-terminal domain-containing protein, partial [Myxococcaceae bacterium]
MTKTRGMMVVAWLCLAASLGSARAAVDPVFMASSPAFDSRRPDVTVDGEGQDVDELTGAAGFAYPFTLPPGRKDLTPKLALRYSSQGGHRGGVAAGWSLPLPAIRRDFSVGTLAAAEYSASVGGASGRLVAVNDASTLGGATYRLREDDAFVRFEFLGAPSFAGLSWTPPTGGWLALAADGTRYYLGGLTQASDGSSRWHLTHEVDPQGNTTRYAWSRVVDGAGRLLDFSLDSIEYTGNPLIGADSHARVDFSYQFDPFGLSACPSSAIPVGARSDNHGGLLYAEGARKLVAVTTFVRDTPTARWRQVRRVQLNYEASTESCSAAFSPFRQLRSLDVSATSPTGVVTLLRPVSFGYGPPQRLLNRTVNDHRGPGLISWGDDQGQTDALLDYDGDGLLDHLQVEQDGSKCVLHVYRGARGGGTAGKYLIDLPMMPWANGTSPAFNEKCSLGGQKTFRANLNPQHSCGHAGNLNAYHFDDVDGDGKVDLLTSLQVDPDSYNPSVDPQVDNGSSVTAANPCAPLTAPTTRTFTAWAGKVGPSVCQFYPTQKNQDCNGQYAWRLYRNVGTALTAFPRLASFGSAMTRVPVPMDPDNSLNGHLGVGSLSTHYGFHAVADLDGDGKLDAILGNQTTSNLFWKVHRGNGNGTFASTAVTWPVPAGVTTQPSSTGQNNFGIPKLSYTFSSLMDVNGDGLADLLTQSGSELSAFLNTGTGFSPTPTRLGVNLTVDMSASYTDAIGGGQILHSHREFVHRLFDVDHDGLPDFLDFSSGAPVYRPNSGDRFLEPRPLHSAWLSARRRIDNSYPGWETTTDAYDRDGDGLPDLVSNSTTAESMTRVHDEFSGAPPRLLNTIDSGRGRVVRFSYALSTDTTAVTQQPGAGTYLPSVNWVVTKVTVSDVGGVPDAVTQYTYADPIYGRESLLLKDAASFLGFKTVTVDRSGPTGGTSLGRRLVKSFAYDLANDARARLVRELTYNRSATGALVLQRDRSMVWTSLPLFNGASFHRAIQSERSTVCAATGACTPTVWNTLRTENTQTPHVHGGMNVLYLASASRRGPGSAPSDQDRRERSTFQVRYGQAPFSASDYRVLEAERLREAATPGSGGNSFTTIGRVVKSYEPASGLLLRIDTALDAARVATTAFTYTSSGQTRTHTRPESFAAGGARKTEYTYDVRELHATQVVNPLGHVVFPSHDVGTGVSLGTKGPQSKQVGTATVWATSSVTIDGLGRVLTESVPVDDAAAGYVSRQTRTVAFNDSSVPATVTTSTLQDFGGAAQVKELQRYDGTGRELSRTRFRQLPGQPDEVWTTTYNALGELATVVGPDPRVDTGATITHKALGYDALGRVILSKAADGSGVATTYDGLVRSDAELTASAGAHKSTFDTKNPFGETIRVDEVDHQAQSAATTFYAHAPQGGVSSVTDADGVVTTYERNFMGEILAVRRGGRTWEHGYD